MYRVRTIKTTSGATAVQVVEYFKNQREILLHLGSASSEEELLELKNQHFFGLKKTTHNNLSFPY